MNSYAKQLHLSDALRATLFRSIMRSLQLPEGSRGLDIGCGIGSNTLMLGEAVGRSGHVTGIDLSEELPALAGQKIRHAGLSQQIAFVTCDMNRPPLTSCRIDPIITVFLLTRFFGARQIFKRPTLVRINNEFCNVVIHINHRSHFKTF